MCPYNNILQFKAYRKERRWITGYTLLWAEISPYTLAR